MDAATSEIASATQSTSLMYTLNHTFGMTTLDILALVFFIACWKGYAYYTVHNMAKSNNLLQVTNHYRAQWMRELLKRETRTMDSIMIGNLLRSITFFANTAIFILFGLVTLLGYHDRAEGIIRNIPYAEPGTGFLWELKIFVLIVIFIYAFFKHTWSLRQYNYAGIFVCSLPAANDRSVDHEDLVKKGTALVSNAAKHFNLGLRAYYFGLAVLGWFIHPIAFMITTILVVYVTYRREYRSNTLMNLR
jgi:uncharacterized membrane protein